ncbi:MAG: four helix bundle protein [Ignavibacteriaceae bacterium]
MLELNHKKLDAWKKSIELVTEIYILTKEFPREESFGLTNQLRRAAVSITSNIAEGSARKSSIERKRFYEIARSSLVELDSQLEISINLNFLKEEKLLKLNDLVNHNFALLTKLILKT